MNSPKDAPTSAAACWLQTFVLSSCATRFFELVVVFADQILSSYFVADFLLSSLNDSRHGPRGKRPTRLGPPWPGPSTFRAYGKGLDTDAP